MFSFELILGWASQLSLRSSDVELLVIIHLLEHQSIREVTIKPGALESYCS